MIKKLCHIERETKKIEKGTVTTIYKIWFGVFKIVIHKYVRSKQLYIIPGINWPGSMQAAVTGFTEYKMGHIIKTIK